MAVVANEDVLGFDVQMCQVVLVHVLGDLKHKAERWIKKKSNCGTKHLQRVQRLEEQTNQEQIEQVFPQNFFCGWIRFGKVGEGGFAEFRLDVEDVLLQPCHVKTHAVRVRRKFLVLLHFLQLPGPENKNENMLHCRHQGMYKQQLCRPHSFLPVRLDCIQTQTALLYCVQLSIVETFAF